MSFLATTSGIRGEDVRDLMVAAVEHRFGPVNRLPITIEWLSDNGSCYIAGDTHSYACARHQWYSNKVKPPSRAHKAMALAEALVRRHLKRDYVRVNPCPDARTVMLQLSSVDHPLQ